MGMNSMNKTETTSPLDHEQRNLRDNTIKDFGDQWTRFNQLDPSVCSKIALQDHFGPLMDVELIRGVRVADIGSGAGCTVMMLLDSGAESRVVTVFDQLNPEYAKYYTKDEARSLLESNGFVDVKLYHRHGCSWTVMGVRD